MMLSLGYTDTLDSRLGVWDSMCVATTTTTQSDESRREEGLMASTFESQVRDFATEFPTPNVLRALALCEDGTLPWEQVAEVLRRSLGHALTEVGA